MRYFIASILCLLCATSARAIDGKELLEMCAATEKPVIEGSDVSMINDITSVAACSHYIGAVIETKDMYDSKRPAHSRGTFCFNGDMRPDSRTLAAIVLKYLRYNPDKLDWPKRLSQGADALRSARV
jgi:hypothetical protein